MRPIDADDFEVKVRKLAELSKTKQVSFDYIIKLLHDQPSMDLRGQIHGTWGGDYIATCSHCGYQYDFGNKGEKFLFCPCCGACMDSKENNFKTEQEQALKALRCCIFDRDCSDCPYKYVSNKRGMLCRNLLFGLYDYIEEMNAKMEALTKRANYLSKIEKKGNTKL